LAPQKAQEELSRKRQDMKALVNEGPSKVLDPYLRQSATPEPKGKK
jgi:hypothetical protein